MAEAEREQGREKHDRVVYSVTDNGFGRLTIRGADGIIVRGVRAWQAGDATSIGALRAIAEAFAAEAQAEVLLEAMIEMLDGKGDGEDGRP